MPNPVEYQVRVMPKFVVSESQNSVAICLEPVCPCFVVLTPPILAMLSAIQFQDELCCWAIEVGDIWANWLLPAETQTGDLFAAEQCPELPLAFGHIGSERACVIAL